MEAAKHFGSLGSFNPAGLYLVDRMINPNSNPNSLDGEKLNLISRN